MSWIVPIGISFHTFQSISYLVDVYRKRMPAMRNPFDYALFLSFFPQLLAGPIVRAELFSPSCSHGGRPVRTTNVRTGAHYFGLLKVSDRRPFCGRLRPVLGAAPLHPGSPAAWTATFAFAMQIYVDFSGYSYIAIGWPGCWDSSFPKTFASRILRRASATSGTAGTSRSRRCCGIISTYRSAAAARARGERYAT